VSGLEKQGVGVAMVTSNTTQERQAQVHKEMASRDANIKLVYVTPEKIAKAKRFLLCCCCTVLHTIKVYSPFEFKAAVCKYL